MKGDEGGGEYINLFLFLLPNISKLRALARVHSAHSHNAHIFINRRLLMRLISFRAFS